MCFEQGSACLDKYKELLEGVLLHASKAYAFTEKVFFQAMTNSLHGVTGQKAHFKFGDFACRFYNLKVELCEQFQRVSLQSIYVDFKSFSRCILVTFPDHTRQG